MSSEKALVDFLVTANCVANPSFDWTADVTAMNFRRDTDTLSLSFTVSAAMHPALSQFMTWGAPVSLDVDSWVARHRKDLESDEIRNSVGSLWESLQTGYGTESSATRCDMLFTLKGPKTKPSEAREFEFDYVLHMKPLKERPAPSPADSVGGAILHHLISEALSHRRVLDTYECNIGSTRLIDGENGPTLCITLTTDRPLNVQDTRSVMTEGFEPDQETQRFVMRNKHTLEQSSTVLSLGDLFQQAHRTKTSIATDMVFHPPPGVVLTMDGVELPLAPETLRITAEQKEHSDTSKAEVDVLISYPSTVAPAL
jgi:hypothetical protein